jgi:hypothetical protein
VRDGCIGAVACLFIVARAAFGAMAFTIGMSRNP